MKFFVFKDGFENLVEHRFSQALGLGIVATAMVAVIQLQTVRQLVLRIVGESEILRFQAAGPQNRFDERWYPAP